MDYQEDHEDHDEYTEGKAVGKEHVTVTIPVYQSVSTCKCLQQEVRDQVSHTEHGQICVPKPAFTYTSRSTTPAIEILNAFTRYMCTQWFETCSGSLITLDPLSMAEAKARHDSQFFAVLVETHKKTKTPRLRAPIANSLPLAKLSTDKMCLVYTTFGSNVHGLVPTQRKKTISRQPLSDEEE